MYDLNYKNLRKGIFFGLPFLLGGLLFEVIFGYVFLHGIIEKNSFDSEVEAVRIDDNCHTDSEGEYSCSPVYTYIVDNSRYTCRVSYSSSSEPKSNQTHVYYDSKNPSDCVTEYESSFSIINFLVILFPLIFIIVGVTQMIKVSKKIKKVKLLNQNGKLIKQLPYRLVPTGMTVNDSEIMTIEVEYTLPSGSTILLRGDPRHDRKAYDADGMVDLLIDPNNPENYYIDFEINRLSGNLPSDYSNLSTQQTSINNQQMYNSAAVQETTNLDNNN